MTIIAKKANELITIQDQYSYDEELTVKSQNRHLQFILEKPGIEFPNGSGREYMKLELNMERDDVLELVAWICQYYAGYYENYPKEIPDVFKNIGQLKGKDEHKKED